MNAEIIAIGNEVVDGSIVNSNAAWLAAQLTQVGLEVRYHTVVADHPEHMKEAFEIARSRASWVLVTGGLGPTIDDRTMAVAAELFKISLVENSEALRRVEKVLSPLGREVTPNQRKQALLPQGSHILLNRVGTASGALVDFQGVQFAFFPGPPAECHPMFLKEFLPHLTKKLPPGPRRWMKVLSCFGIPEGAMDQSLKEKLEIKFKKQGVELGFQVKFPAIDIRLSCLQEKKSDGEALLEQAASQVRGVLAKHIFTEGGENLAQVLGSLLREKKKSLASAESCTGGLFASEITDIPGSSDYFLEGVVSYSNNSKVDLLGVPHKTLEKFGAVSRESALAMASGIKKRAGSDYGIGITGIAGPGGGSKAKPTGTVHIAIDHPGGLWERKYIFPFKRLAFKRVVVATGLNRLRRLLLETQS